MTILYSCIARGSTILSSQSLDASSEYEKSALSVISSIPTRNDGKKTFSASGNKWHCLVENGIIFMCTAKSNFPSNKCYGYLTEIKDKFHNDGLALKAVSAIGHELDGDMGYTMKQEMEKYSKKEDNIKVLQSQVDEVKGVMTQNIEKVIERGERLDDLLDKTDELQAQSSTFQKTANKIKKKYWWKNLKMKIIIAIVIFIIIVGIVLAIIFGGGFINKSDTTTVAPISTQKPAG
ncbi:hypothetical protein ACJMK2_034301 [Sinanodonta woodiana]|uniref:Vesicle-associated membrane protein 7 n=1 Tax=Sinanodonta woodiana TaxID=1069815 RepID=A0ABD3WR46_SINWO